MIQTTLIFIAGVVIFFFDGYPLIKKKKKKEFFIFSVILFLGVFIYIGLTYDLPIPRPNDIIAQLLGPIYKPIVSWVK